MMTSGSGRQPNTGVACVPFSKRCWQKPRLAAVRRTARLCEPRRNLSSKKGVAVNHLGTAIVGTGFITPVHVEALRRLARPIVGILGSSLQKSRAAAQALHIPKAYDRYEDLLADPDVGVVHITSPNGLHFEQCRLALAAGKHVLCEKPLAMTAEETATLVALARQSPLVTAVCYNVRFYPLCLEARQRLADGELGAVYHVTGSYTQDWLLYDTDYNWRVSAEVGGACGRWRISGRIGWIW